jgi:hypothetical protein
LQRYFVFAALQLPLAHYHDYYFIVIRGYYIMKAEEQKILVPKGKSPIQRGITLDLPKIILAIILIFVGVASINYLSSNDLVIGGRDFTSIGLLLSGLVFYAGIIVIVTLFENETLLSFMLLLPSIVAVAVSLMVYRLVGIPGFSADGRVCCRIITFVGSAAVYQSLPRPALYDRHPQYGSFYVRLS